MTTVRPSHTYADGSIPFFTAPKGVFTDLYEGGKPIIVHGDAIRFDRHAQHGLCQGFRLMGIFMPMDTPSIHV